MRFAVLAALLLLVPGCLEAKPAAQDFVQMRDAEPRGVSAECGTKARIELGSIHASDDGFQLTLRDGGGGLVWSHTVREGGQHEDIRATVTGESGTWRFEGRSLGEGQFSNNYGFFRLMCL